MHGLLWRPAVRDLVFQVYDRPLHPELFDILAVQTVERPDFRLTVRVTRTGHIVTWQTQAGTLEEVLTAMDDCLPQRRLLSYRFRGEHHCRTTLGNRLSYQSSFHVETLPDELFQKVQNELVADGRRRGLLHRFHPHHRWALTPVSFISVEGRPGCQVAHAFHTFPEELAIIKSQSLVELAPR